MFPKRIDKKSDVKDNFGQLADYIAAAPGHKKSDDLAPSENDNLAEYIADTNGDGEKLDKLWIINCNAGDDFKRALMEIDNTRSQNNNVNNKTYHLLVSFHPGEEDYLSEEDLRDIEQNFAEALGFGEHQRIAATHKNTQNYHMHFAINKIHPQSFNCITPKGDYKKMERVARAMEKKYGLIVDRGMSDRKKDQQSSKAKNFEAKTWQQSFDSYVREHGEGISQTIKKAKNWQSLHHGLAEYDISIKKRGAGLAFHEQDGKQSVKASTLGRANSLKNLEERLGPYEPAEEHQKIDPPRAKPRFKYSGKPLTKHPGQNRLWDMYTQGKKQPGFLQRNFGLKSWKYYLMAEANKDPMAMVTIVFYRELLHIIDAPNNGLPPTKIPVDIKPALHKWFQKQDWLPAGEKPLERPGQIIGAGLRIDDDDRILFSMRDKAGVVWSVRAMDQNGKTSDIGSVSDKAGLHHTLDTKKLLTGRDGHYDGPIILAVDCATAAALHKQTSAPVIIAAHESDLVALAEHIRADNANNPVLIMANQQSQHARLAAEAITGRHHTAIDMLAISPDLADNVKLATPSALDTKKLLQNNKRFYEGPIILTSLRDTAGELHKATGVPAVAVDLDKDLPTAAKELRQKYKTNEIIIMADKVSVPAQRAAKTIKGKHIPAEELVLASSQLKAKGFQQKPPAHEI